MSQIVYVLSLKTWEDPIAHHWYGRIHWESPAPCDHGSMENSARTDWTDRCMVCHADWSKAGFRSADSLAPPDAEGFRSVRHETRESAIRGARQWFAEHGKSEDVLVEGVWTLVGWDPHSPYKVLEGRLSTG